MLRLLALLSMAVPGLVLGLGYIMFFNHPQNPLNFLYQTMAILAISTVVHYYTSGHLTAVTALKALDDEFEAVSASLKVPFYKTFWRVTVPVCLPAILEIARYYFVVSISTLSCVVFLYAPHTIARAVAIMNMDEAGDIGPAAALGTLIVLASAAVCFLYALISGVLLSRSQRWRFNLEKYNERAHPPHPRPAHHLERHQARHGARLGLARHRLHRDQPRACASCSCNRDCGENTHVCVPLQGSGTFSVEAMLGTMVPQERPRAGAAERRLLQAHREDLLRSSAARTTADRLRGAPAGEAGGHRRRPGEGPVDHPRRAGALRDQHRHPESAGRGGRRRGQARQEPDRRRDELVRARSTIEGPVRRAGRRLGQVPRRAAGNGLCSHP